MSVAIQIDTSFRRAVRDERCRARLAAWGVSDEKANERIWRAFDQIEAAQEHCRSPIERLLLPWLVMEDYGPDLMTAPAEIHLPDYSDPPNADVFIVPQFAFVKYRLDFAVCGRAKHGGIRIVGVECDGAAFHDAARDAERDAYLASWGIITVRADGRAIHRDPGGVARRVADKLIEVTA